MGSRKLLPVLKENELKKILFIFLALIISTVAFAADYSWHNDGVATLGTDVKGWKQLFLSGARDAIIFQGATIDGYTTTIRVTDPTANRIITLPNSSGTIALSPVVEDEANGIWYGNGTIVFEGATADAYETSLGVTDPTADRTITLPNASGKVVLASGAATHGVMLWGDASNSFDTGTEVCAAAGLSCAFAYQVNGTPVTDCSTDVGSVTAFYALCY
jgi:hypothetical protein